MKRLLLLPFIAIFFLEAKTQLDSASLRQNIYVAEDSMFSILKRGDWKAYAGYMHPVIIEMSGGKEKFVQTLSGLDVLKQVSFDVYKPGKILQLVKTDKEYQAIVETFMQMQVNGTMVSGSSYDVAVSSDGKKWTLFRLEEKYTPAMIRETVPGLSPDLKFPKSQMVGDSLEKFLLTYELQYL
jgi:hypothetical protein